VPDNQDPETATEDHSGSESDSQNPNEGSETNPVPIASFSQSMLDIMRLGFPMALSDAYAFQKMLLPIFWGHLSQNPQHMAANALILSSIDLAIVTALSPLFELSIKAVPLIRQHEEAAEGSEERRQTQQEIANLFRNGLIYSGLAGTLVMLPFDFSSSLFKLMGQNPETSDITQAFLRPYSLSVPAIFFCCTCAQIFQSFQFTPAMYSSALCMIFGFAISCGLGYGLGGLPNLGESGVLAGYVSEPYFSALLMIGFIMFHKKFDPYPLFRTLGSSLQGNGKAFLEFLMNGGTITLCILFDLMLFFIGSNVAGIQGTRQQETLAIVMQYPVVNSVIAVHFPLAAMIILGSVLGNRNYQQIRNVSRAGITTSMLVGSVIPLFFTMFPQALMSMAGQEDPEISDQLPNLTLFVSLCAILDVLRFALLFQLRIMGETKRATAIFAICQSIGLLSILFLGLGTSSIYGTLSGFFIAPLLNNFALGFFLHSRIEMYREQPQADTSTNSGILNRLYGFFCRSRTPADVRPVSTTLREIIETSDQEDHVRSLDESSLEI
jgi:Na+-driven multidrug efflux pump